MKLVDAILAIVLWGICLPLFIQHFIAIERSYDETIRRLKELSDVRETIFVYAACHKEKTSYPHIDGYTVTEWTDTSGGKRESLQFNWKGKKITYEFR